MGSHEGVFTEQDTGSASTNLLSAGSHSILVAVAVTVAITVAAAVAQVAQALQPGIKHYLVKHNLSSTYKNQAYPRFKHCPKVKHNPKKHKHYLNQAHFTRKSISFPGVHDSSVTQFSDRVEFSSSTTQFQ